MKTWIFRQTEIRKPKDNTEIVDFEGFPTMVSELLYPHREYPILTLEVHEEDPLKPILEVWNSLKNSPFLKDENMTGYERELWRAFQKCMAIVEGK